MHSRVASVHGVPNHSFGSRHSSVSVALPEAEAAITTNNTLVTLLARCADRDPDAFRSLYDAQAGRLYGLALRITRDPELAADAVQDTFLLVWRRAERFDETRGGAEAWLATLVRYRAIDIQRRRSREQPSETLPERATDDADALDSLMQTAEGTALRHCLAALPAERRSLLLRAFVGGRSYAALATENGEPLGTVKARIRRALAALKLCLES